MLLFLWMILQLCLESLPISSSGHTSLLFFYFPEVHGILSLDQLKFFDWALHSITLLVITIFFWNNWWQLILHKKFHIRFVAQVDFWKKMIPAFLFVSLATFVFFAFYILQSFFSISWIKIPLLLGFSCTALELIFMNRFLIIKKDHIKISWNLWHALILGIVNSLLVHIPGVSRFGTNFLACQLFGYKPADAFAISWLVFVPFALAGGLYGIMKVSSDSYLLAQLLHMPMLIGMVASGIISYMLLYCFAYFIEHKNLKYLVWYMIVPIAISLGQLLCL